jgi:hypothetical protein
MKIVNLILAVMFLLFAFLQINDPDPLVWIFIYGAMAVICVLAAFRIYSKVAMAVLLVVYLAYAYTLIPGVRGWYASPDRSALFDEVMKMRYPYIEEAREFLGLCINLAALAWIFFLASRRKSVS